MTRGFSDLVVWQRSHAFVLDVYRLSSGFPSSETYGLTAQLRRAAVSVPANIAEGFRRIGKADKARFLNIAEGSAEECRYYLILAQDLGYCDSAAPQAALEEVVRMLASYIRAVRSSESPR